MYEDNLIPLFETVGIVLQFRLMMNYSGRNRGFGYIIYLDQNDGHRAILNLDNILVSSWCRLQLCISRNLRRLWLDNVCDELDVNAVIGLILDKVDPVEVRMSWLQCGFRNCNNSIRRRKKRISNVFIIFQISVCRRYNRLRFLLDFETHRDAALSRKQLLREVWDFGPSARANWDTVRDTFSRGWINQHFYLSISLSYYLTFCSLICFHDFYFLFIRFSIFLNILFTYKIMYNPWSIRCVL